MTDSIRVLHADDHPVVLDGFANALESHGIHTVAKAHSVPEALAQYAATQPDVAILDLRFGSALTGLDAARQLLHDFPQAKIVFLSQFDQDSLIKEAYRLGARAFITKDCDPAELAQMAEGLTNQEIADQLQLSSKTISNTSQTIKEKLQVQRAADITRLALRHGLLSA